jgi:hypothetical protein
MGTLSEQLFELLPQKIRPRGNAQGPITAVDETAMFTLVIQAIETLEQAAEGNRLRFGVEAPAPEVGLDGDAFLNYQAADIYEKVDGEWKLRFTFGAGGSGGPLVFPDDTPPIVASFTGGKTLGTLLSGQTLQLGGRQVFDVLTQLAVEAIFPTYNVASVSLTQTAPQLGEVGAAVANSLTATFNRGDAGAVTALRIMRNAALLGAVSATSPITRSSNEVRIEGRVTYRAFADYAAGLPKPVQPANTPDTRPAAVRNANAPQAAESDLGSNEAYLDGVFPWFCGFSDTDTAPDIYAGQKFIAASNGALVVPGFGANGSKWLWFAVPRKADGSSQKTFTSWYRTALDNGAIGGGANLFRNPVLKSVSSNGLAADWTRDYDLYFSNYATEAGTATTLN